MDSETRTQKLSSLQTRWNSISGKVSLDQINDAIEDLGHTITNLPQTIADLRQRGYIYNSAWESRVAAITKAWPTRRIEAQGILRRQRDLLSGSSAEITSLFDKGRWSDSAVDSLERRLTSLESQISSAETHVRGAYDRLQQDVSGLQAEFRRVEYCLKALSDATFQLYTGESGVFACEAELLRDQQEIKGVLFLTDHRLIFEQREKRATKKVLFVTTKSELVQEKLWESPVGAIVEVQTEDKGLFKGQQYITFHFTERTRELPSDPTLQLHGITNDECQAWVEKAKSGDLAKESVNAAAAPKPATPAVEPTAPKEVPTKCPACGAQLPTAYQGTRELRCEYCGTVVYL